LGEGTMGLTGVAGVGAAGQYKDNT
jgi:hypothetical protein